MTNRIEPERGDEKKGTANVNQEYDGQQAIHPISEFIIRLPRPKKQQSEGGAPVLEVNVIKKLAKILRYYKQIIDSSNNQSPSVQKLTGTILIASHFQDYSFIIDHIQHHESGPSINCIEMDLGRIMLKMDAFNEVFEDAIEYFKISSPLILLMVNGDSLFLKRQPSPLKGITEGDIAGLRFFLRNKRLFKEKIITVFFSNEPWKLSRDIYNSIDFILDIDVPDDHDKELFLKYLFNDPTLVMRVIAREMNGWSWNDIELFYKKAMMEKEVQGLKSITVKFLLDIINGENDQEIFIPPSKKYQEGNLAPTRAPREANPVNEPSTPPMESSREVGCSIINDPFREQLWQVAASRDYELLLQVLDRIERGILMDEDRKTISKYPFLLIEEPIEAKKKLDSAKAKVEMLKKKFKNESRT